MAVALCAGVAGAAQQKRREPNGADLLRVFLDCGPCDDEFLRREINFVNYVRDRRDAQVHVLITRENTGGGGDAWTLDFYGLDDFSGMDDQLVFYTTQDDTRRQRAPRAGPDAASRPRTVCGPRRRSGRSSR